MYISFLSFFSFLLFYRCFTSLRLVHRVQLFPTFQRVKYLVRSKKKGKRKKEIILDALHWSKDYVANNGRTNQTPSLLAFNDHWIIKIMKRSRREIFLNDLIAYRWIEISSVRCLFLKREREKQRDKKEKREWEREREKTVYYYFFNEEFRSSSEAIGHGSYLRGYKKKKQKKISKVR